MVWLAHGTQGRTDLGLCWAPNLVTTLEVYKALENHCRFLAKSNGAEVTYDGFFKKILTGESLSTSLGP